MSIISKYEICHYCKIRIAYYTLKNGKKCCEPFWQRCPKKRAEQKIIMKEVMNRPESKKRISELRKNTKDSDETKNKKRLALLGNQRKKGKKETQKTRYKKSISHKRTIEYIKKRYFIFCMQESMRYDPVMLKKNIKSIQVHCKNNKCVNSKEKEGWFTPTSRQIEARIFHTEYGNGGSYFYCSQKCKDECILYNLHGDPYRDINLPYTQSEYQIFRNFVLERDNYICQFCGNKAIYVHHERPQKLEPFFALDPDFAWSCCEKCHYEKGHKDECSTGNLAKIVC